MARGIRKSTLEKLQEELESTQETIVQYEGCLKTLKEKVKVLAEQIEVEELKSLSGFMKNQNLSVEELIELVIQSKNNEKQSV